MQRALAISLLQAALGDHETLPSPSELQRILAEAEVSLFTGGGTVDSRLLDCGWFLHAVAGARPDLDVYTDQRRRRAHQVSAHIFDVHLQSMVFPSDGPQEEQLRYAFAAQVGYLGGDLTPNASAIGRRLDITPASVIDRPGLVSLQAGILLLALDRARLFPLIQSWRSELPTPSFVGANVSDSAYAAVDGVVRGCYDLLIYLVYGEPRRLNAARIRLRAALTATASQGDTDSRWVAAQLLSLADGMEASSVWALVPPMTPSAARAMTLGDPPVLLLWPPQLEFLRAGGASPLDRATKRMLLSFPTSAGKTLLAHLVILSHLTTGEGSACVVAPTHSLCREIQLGLDRRLSTLGSRSASMGPLGSDDVVPAQARAVVMTPERLSAMLHADPEGLLARFNLFVFDEAHLVADAERGWHLEETMSLLHHLTRDTDHRLVVLSAALGNRAHFTAWLSVGSEMVERHSDWRGPRRLHAVYTTTADRSDATLAPPEGRRLPRRSYPLRGTIHLRTGSRFYAGNFSQPVGTLAERQDRHGMWIIDSEQNTPHRTRLVPLVVHLAATGPVLVVQATKSGASLLAQEISRGFDAHPLAQPLVELARTRVGENHPLTRVLAQGVAFHHAALPEDLQAEIEDAVRANRIRVLVATTTLTEGVNLPFKSVIIAERGWGTGPTRTELIDAPRLLNAVGRAGRAGRETEGWLILAEQRQFHASQFNPLDVTGDDLEVRSRLTAEDALVALATFEQLVASSEDAVLADSGQATAGFCSFVWFIAEALAELGRVVTAESVMAALQDTLAWHQMSEPEQARWRVVASASLSSYEGQQPALRRRWARGGTSLSTALRLDRIGLEIAELAIEHGAPTSMLDTLDLLLGGDRLAAILSFPENRARGFKRRKTDPVNALIDLDLLAMLRRWIAGDSIEDLGSDFLSEVADDDYRYEQLSDFVTGVFGHYLPWMLGTLLIWINATLAERDSGFVLSDKVPAHIHYGIPTAPALEMASAGVRSRRLAVLAADAYLTSGDSGGIRDWLIGRDVGNWRRVLDASPTEIADLLVFVRAPGALMIARLLEGETAEIPFVPTGAGVAVAELPHPLGLAEETGPAPRGLLVMAGDHVVGRIGPAHHDHVSELRDLGMPLEVTIDPAAASVLRVRLGVLDE
jgi:DEAD/DEAH box helicase/Helicase conserved C-terminal domain